MSVKKIINAVKDDNKNRAEQQQYYQDKQNRKAKKKIRAESKDGMYEGPGLGKAKARELAEIVAKQDRKDKEQYGGMDMPTKAKGGSVKKMAYGGKAMKMAEGGSLPMVKKGGKMVPAFAADGVGKMSYGGKVKKMAYGGKAMKMADGKMVTKKKKTTKVTKRRGDGCAVKGKTRGRMV